MATFAKAEDEEPTARVVGGQDADLDEYPFFTSWSTSCGGTLIHDDILLTAAHCNPVETNQVVVNAYHKGGPSLNSQLRWIERRIIHPEYNVDTWNYDVMLLKLSQPVTSVQKVKLNNNRAKPAVLDTVTPLGLGRIAEVAGEFPEVLQEVNVRVIDSNKCNTSPMYPGWIQESMICAGVSTGGLDACFGDSGGPLLQKDLTTNEIIQVGVVSFGTGCARPDKPGVYHRVSSSYDWIQEQICEFSANKPSTCPGFNPDPIPDANTRDVLVDLTVPQPEQQQQQTVRPEQQQTVRPEQQQTVRPEQQQTVRPEQQQTQQPQQQTQQPQTQQPEQNSSLYTHPQNPPRLPLGLCQGDCDNDSDCSEGLFCFFKTNGIVQRVPGCEGNDSTSTDFCVDIKYRTQGTTSNPVRQSIFMSNKSGFLRGSAPSDRFGKLQPNTRAGSGLLRDSFMESNP